MYHGKKTFKNPAFEISTTGIKTSAEEPTVLNGNGSQISDFTNFTCQVKEHIKETAGSGNRMTITSISESTELTRSCKLKSVDKVLGLLHIRISYKVGDASITRHAPDWI